MPLYAELADGLVNGASSIANGHGPVPMLVLLGGTLEHLPTYETVIIDPLPSGGGVPNQLPFGRVPVDPVPGIPAPLGRAVCG